MKHLNTYITEYIVKKKLDKFIDSEYSYHPKTKDELIEDINELLDSNKYNFNCIDTSAITDMSNLFSAIDIRYQYDDIDISNWDVSNVTNMNSMFYSYYNFNCDLSKWDVSKVEDMSDMFNNCGNFEGKGLENWDVSNVKYMDKMFSYCVNFTGKGLENWNIRNVTRMNDIFEKCTSLKNKPSWYKE